MKLIKDYLPKKKKEDKPQVTVVQGRVPSELGKEIKQILDAQNLGWNEFLTACLMSYRDEMKGAKK